MSEIKLKPSKPISAGTLIILIFMLLFGIAFAVLIGEEIYDYGDEPVLKILFSLFMFIWIGGILFMVIYHVLNIKRSKGLSLIDIDAETGFSSGRTDKDPMQRLRDLEALRKDKLIAKDEFDRKRKEIMAEKW